MAISMGMMGSVGPSTSPSWMAGARSNGGASNIKGGRRGGSVRCAAAAGGLTDQYRTLRIKPGASEREVKKAFRQLALKYHPDVCKEGDCGVQFHRINEAYDVVMNNLRAVDEPQPAWDGGDYAEEPVTEAGWDLWEEWMGWEGAGITDYTSHINPYI